MINKIDFKRIVLLVLTLAIVFSCVAINTKTGRTDGALRVPIHRNIILDDQVVPFGKTVGANPFFGNSRDYTVYQGTRSGDIVLETEIISMSVDTLARYLALRTGCSEFLTASEAIKLAIAIGSNSETMYYEETVYAHKTMPNYYHKYIRKWYIDSEHRHYVNTSVFYDGFV